jgi:outer membrane protein
VKLTSAAGALDLERDSFGLAYGVGANYQLENGWYLNFDVKKMNLRSDVYLVSTGAKVSEVKADPLLVGFGVGWETVKNSV